MVVDTTPKVQDNVPSPLDTSPKGQVPSLNVPAETSPPGTPRTYTQVEVDNLLRDTKREAGRAQKTVEVERDSLRGQVRLHENKLSDLEVERENLDKRIEELSSKDPELNNLEKRAKQIREMERKAQAKANDAETKVLEFGERIKRAETFEVERLAEQIAEDYEGGDGGKLKSLCETLGTATEEKIRAIADTLWNKKGVIPATPGATVQSSKPYTGVTGGGGPEKTDEQKLKERYPTM